MRWLLTSTLCCLLLASIASAQANRGTITGTVTDDSGGVVPGATVVAEEPQTGTKYETVTTTTGKYSIAQVPVGVYNLTVELARVGKFRHEGSRRYAGGAA